ncbi:MAG: CDP-glycerol glycerophosphotransferase family protein [Microbacteriaceae bacterium]
MPPVPAPVAAGTGLGTIEVVAAGDGAVELLLAGTGVAPASASLAGDRDRPAGTIEAGTIETSTIEASTIETGTIESSTIESSTADGGSAAGWRARIPLTVPRRGAPGVRPLHTGVYTLRLDDARGVPLTLDVTAAGLPERRHGALFRLAAGTEHGVVTVTVSAPLADDELGRASQRRLLAGYRRERVPLAEAVFFESYYGRTAGCNPLGIDRALAAAHPEVVRYWSVADASVAVPAGAVPVIEGSAAWWRARASCRLLVVNDWLRGRWRPRPGQRVLQTWHGTPLKRIGLDKPGLRPRARLAALRESRRWDALLAQNPYSAEAFRHAFLFRGPIWQEGYPRDDVLAAGDGAAVRARLGIRGDETVVLYAPTWRDDRVGEIDHLDVARFQRLLGPGHRTLIRGHARTIEAGADVVPADADDAGVIDVTGHDDIAELYLAADIVVTDYSSVMFDATVAHRPLLFHMPDLERYRDETRGFRFDPFPVLPGPVARSAEELAGLVRALPRRPSGGPDVPEGHRERYRAWRERFNPRDDGAAGLRVVERLYREGFLG